MIAQVIPLRLPRRPSPDLLARLLDLEQETMALLAQGRRLGKRLEELRAEREELERAILGEGALPGKGA